MFSPYNSANENIDSYDTIKILQERDVNESIYDINRDCSIWMDVIPIFTINCRFIQFWEFLGLLNTILILMDLFHLIHTPLYLFTIIDIYFIFDIFIRFHKEYIDNDTHEVVSDIHKIRWNYFKSWLLFDIIISIPYGSLKQFLQERPMIEMLEYKDKKILSVGKLILSKKFRRYFIGKIKDIIVERNVIKNVIDGNISLSSTMEQLKYRPNTSRVQSKLRRILGISMKVSRILLNLKVWHSYKLLVKSFLTFMLSIRSLSVLLQRKRGN